MRQEFISPERFEIIAENVRAEFGREIYQEELKDFQEEKGGVVSQIRLDELGRAFADLAAKLPSHGALKYAYLPSDYKEKLDGFLKQIVSVTDFQRLEKKYLRFTDEISQMYGNGEEKKVYNREKALEALYKGMGNTVPC